MDYTSAIATYEEALAAAIADGKKSEILFRMARCNEKKGDKNAQIVLLKELIRTGDKDNKWVKKADQIVSEHKKSEMPSPEVNQLRDTLLKATEINDLDLFHSVCNKTMKDALTKELLTSVSDQIADLLKAGYEAKYQSKDIQGLYSTYVWSIQCKGGAKFTMTMSLDTKARVAGCFFK